MEELPIDIEKKIEELPIIDMNEAEEFQKLITSEQFSDVFDFYKSNYLPDILKSKPEIYQRVSLYLSLTGQGDKFIEDTDQVLYRRPVPTIEEFLTNNFYHGRLSATMYPYWKDKFREIFRPGSPVKQIIYQGCIGSGKSTSARKAMVYMLYKILCLRYPRAVFNIDADSTIAAFIISVSLRQVYDTNLLPFVKLLENMPCFQRVMNMKSFDNFNLDDPRCPFPFFLEKSTATVFFPNNIILTAGSQIQHTVGYNIPLCFCLTGDTKIHTTEGDLSFEQVLNGFEKGISYKTYCYDKDEVKETTIIDIKLTNYTDKLIKIWIDDENFIECTSNHMFAIKNPKPYDKNIRFIHDIAYKEAQYLSEEDELIDL